MKKEKFERDFNIKISDLSFAKHYCGTVEYAVIREFTIYHDLETDEYQVVRENSVHHWREDLGKLLTV